jgi:hypothetical protein
MNSYFNYWQRSFLDGISAMDKKKILLDCYSSSQKDSLPFDVGAVAASSLD